jgi:hypothetical protein
MRTPTRLRRYGKEVVKTYFMDVNDPRLAPRDSAYGD